MWISALPMVDKTTLEQMCLTHKQQSSLVVKSLHFSVASKHSSAKLNNSGNVKYCCKLLNGQ
uniref:Uncharacterized protein n=1 Tax=Globisporangium ultimum (strain ATCC 200006 / CBS 805.95 / DAOM BR144) TaxID=431595 RepID=K3WQM2_GLOUD